MGTVKKYAHTPHHEATPSDNNLTDEASPKTK